MALNSRACNHVQRVIYIQSAKLSYDISRSPAAALRSQAYEQPRRPEINSPFSLRLAFSWYPLQANIRFNQAVFTPWTAHSRLPTAFFSAVNFQAAIFFFLLDFLRGAATFPTCIFHSLLLPSARIFFQFHERARYSLFFISRIGDSPRAAAGRKILYLYARGSASIQWIFLSCTCTRCWPIFLSKLKKLSDSPKSWAPSLYLTWLFISFLILALRARGPTFYFASFFELDSLAKVAPAVPREKT